MTSVTRLPAKSSNHQKKLHRKEDDEKDKSTSKAIDPIPLDLEVDILTRLPGKSIMKFLCVSKIWSSIIRSQVFVDSFYATSSTRARFIVALSNGIYGDFKKKRVFIFSSSHEKPCSVVAKLDMAIPYVNFNVLSGSCASIHGFLSFNAGGGRFMICNPCTQQLVHLPVGFLGYDPIGKQHKALSLEGNSEHKVLTLGGVHGWRRIQGTTVPYNLISVGVCINGFVYYGAFTATPYRKNPVIVCFDVRSEKLSLIKAPLEVVFWCHRSTLMEYKGKLASIALRCPYSRFDSFDLWVLEDVHRHEWSKQTCVVPLSLWDSITGLQISFPGTNKAGDLILAPKLLSHDVARPFYIFYYNVQTQNITRVSLPGIGDDEDFRRRHGFGTYGECHVRISPHHVDSIAFFKDPI